MFQPIYLTDAMPHELVGKSRGDESGWVFWRRIWGQWLPRVSYFVFGPVFSIGNGDPKMPCKSAHEYFNGQVSCGTFIPTIK